MSEDGYSSWSALAAAFKVKAAKAIKDGQSTHDINAQLTQLRFDRFLSRVFAAGSNSEWMLKGGGAMLARVPRSRGTRDLDLSANSEDLAEAVRDLEQRASADLGDHVRVELVRTVETGRGDNQPGTQTLRAQFAAFDATTGKKIGDVPVDIVVGPPPIGTPELVTPANRLALPKELQSHPYRLYPLADQVAEKVCATLSTYGGAPSTRVKDLVDLVVIAKTQSLNARELQMAIDAKRGLSQIRNADKFAVPASWERQYEAMAKSTQAAGGMNQLLEAQEFVSSLVDPAMSAEPIPPGVTWIPDTGWAPSAPTATEHASPTDSGTTAAQVWVRSHVRSGSPVREHTRTPRTR